MIKNAICTFILMIIAGVCQANTMETIFTLSDDTKTATKYFSSKNDLNGTYSYLFDINYNKNYITYARPSNYNWNKYYSQQDKKNYLRITFSDTSSYAFLERLNNSEADFFWKDKDSSDIYYLYVSGSACAGVDCAVDESIISTIIPARFEVLKYFAVVNGKKLEPGEGDWKIVDNTYTFYRDNLKGANTYFVLQDSATYNSNKLSEAFKNNQNISVSNEGNRVRVVVPIENLFVSGSADMQKNGLEWISVLKESLKTMNFVEVRVEGHTDNVPIVSKTKSGYASNWELSAARSANIVQYLIKNGISPDRIAAVGYADAHPISSNDTPDGRAKNRRIEFSILTSETTEPSSSN